MRRSTAFCGRTTTTPAPRRLALTVVVVSLLAPFALVSPAVAASLRADTVSDKRANAARLAAQLTALNERSSALAEAYDQATIHLNQVNSQVAAARAQMGQTSAQLSGAQARVRDMAIESYMQGGAARQLSLLIPSSASEIAVRGTYVQSVTASTNDAVDALRAAHSDLARLQAQLAAAQAAAAKAVAQVRADQAAAASADAQTEAAYSQAQSALGQAVLLAAEQAQQAANQARARAAATQVTATTSRRGGHSPAVLVQSNAPLPPPGAGAGSAIAWAKAELGKPYVYGGAGPDSFDCSGLTAWAWGHAGHPLPHSSESQYYDTTHVSVADLQPGDLVFYGMPPHHVGIYVGGGQMINALHSGTNVEYDSIYMESDLIGGGRVN